VELLGNKILFGALPGVAKELRLLFRLRDNPHGIFEGETLQDAKFTKAAMLSALRQKRPLVHIASHFAFRPGDEERSFLLVGDGTAFTLAEMKQQGRLFDGVELLTLSACNTAAQASRRQRTRG
jgi:CHAT domain-containing protein